MIILSPFSRITCDAVRLVHLYEENASHAMQLNDVLIIIWGD